MTNVTKQRLGVEDMLVGNGVTQQLRGGAMVPVTAVSGASLPLKEAVGPTIGDVLLPKGVSFTDKVYFDKANVYGIDFALNAPVIEADIDSLVPGVEITIFHQASVVPTFTIGGTPWKKQGGSYTVGTVNMIVARHLIDGRIDYVICPAAGT